jgi:GNAT superfamily N-acetyltransferase
MAELLLAAFESDPLHMAMLPREHTDSIMDWYQGRIRSALADYNMRTMLAVDTPEADSDAKEAIVGYSRWLLPSESSEHDNHDSNNQKPTVTFPHKANKPLVDFYLQQCDDIRGKYMDTSHDIVLYVLATDPAYQGHGIGRMMLEWGINTAAQLSETRPSSLNKIPRILLEATPLAYPIYKKFGWKDYNSITIDLHQYGIENGIEHTTVCMIRE